LQTIGSSWDSYSTGDAKIEDIDFEKVKEYIKFANETGSNSNRNPTTNKRYYYTLATVRYRPIFRPRIT
jgi:predicted HTH transcriptional regulator